MTGNADGTIQRWKDNNVIKTVKLKGTYPLVKYVDGQIICVLLMGKVNKMDMNLCIQQEYDDINQRVLCLVVTKSLIAYGDARGTVKIINRKDFKNSWVSLIETDKFYPYFRAINIKAVCFV